MKKRQVIITTAVAATAAMSSILPLNKISAVTVKDSNTIEKAANHLGLSPTELLDAFKKARIEIIEEKIKTGLIDTTSGIDLIHKIEDSEDFYFLPKVS